MPFFYFPFIMKSILVFVCLRIYFIECRVYCQDSHASPWTPLGISCPVNCDNIVTAVKRLKTLDYKNLFIYKLRHNENASIQELSTEMTKTNDIFNRPVRRSFNFIKTNTHKMFQDKKLITTLKIAIKMTLNGTFKCSDKIGGKTNMSNCRRTYDHDEFIKKFTVLLNKYTEPEHQFTEEMTSIILEKILGTNMDLRHGLFDVKRILKYLTTAIRYHRTHTKQDLVIRLKSKHCLTIHVPGCYCKIGLVESSGQCVDPSDCVEKIDSQYLERIVLL